MLMTRNRTSIDIVKALIAINVVVFVAGLFDATKIPALFCIPLPQGEPTPIAEVYGAYSYLTCFSLHEVWRLITYQFLHANLGHLVFNMVALSIFGGAVADRFGAGRFLAFYFICGAAGALFSTLLGALGLIATTPAGPLVQAVAAYAGATDLPVSMWMMIPMVGASASIYGVLVATAFLFPTARIQLIFPPVDMTVRTLALLVLGFAVVVIAADWSNAGGEAGHLGGMIMGAFLMLGRSLWMKN